MEVKVLFVDDDISVINSLSSLLYERSKEYKFYFTRNAIEALKIIDEEKIEIILTDLNMPKVSGIQLLEQVKEKFPSVIRITFAEKSEEKKYSGIAQVAHQFIQKPFEAEELFKCLSKILALRQYLSDENLIRVVNGISKLPTLPNVYLELVEELSSKDVSMHRIGEIISHDISFTMKILQVVNSPFFGLAKKITEPIQAVNYLGRNIIKSLLLFNNLYTSFTINSNIQDYFDKMWMHSNKVGRFGKELIYMTYYDEIEMMEDAYIGGLLHDIGKVVLLSLDEYPQNVFDLMKEEKIRFSAAEYKLYGTSHAEVGAYFLSLWNLPERIVDAVYSHKRNSKIDFSHFTVPNSVYIANRLASISDMELETLRNLRLGTSPAEWMKYIEEAGNN